jgi:short subunit dehydrogenase-like uncharacterized protein
MDRKYDIVLFGATGFTGKLIASYLDKHISAYSATWAIAGRNPVKLEALQNELASKPDIITADVDNQEEIHAMAGNTRILMNAAGPFNWYGRIVVEACVASGTHYLDITGEPAFVADVYTSFDKTAIHHKSCVINCCGFDSIPADLTVFKAMQLLPPDEPKAVWGFVQTNATFSGGTITTAINALHRQVKEKSRIPSLPKHPNAPKISRRIHLNRDVSAWAVPMPVVDPHIVKRSAYKMPDIYGKAFTYAQFFLRSTFVKVVKMVTPIILAMLLVRFKTFRQYMLKKFAPGTGPDSGRRSRSVFRFTCVARSTSRAVKVVMSGGDPGYDETAKMFSESAFIVLDKERSGKLSFGVKTPAEALGNELMVRLMQEGIRIESQDL